MIGKQRREHGALNQIGYHWFIHRKRVFRYNDNSRRPVRSTVMKTLTLKGVRSPRRYEERLPPGSGLVMTAAASIVIWAIVAAVALLT
jgi:hypothetical protein